MLRFGARPVRAAIDDANITILKPLHGPEPRLEENLATFFAQLGDWQGRIVAGVARADDPAAGVFRRAAAAHPEVDAQLVIDGRRHGANAKICNLINMLGGVGGAELLVLSDSDMAAPPGYLSTVLGALSEPGVGAVSCLYRGRGDAGFWSRVAAAGVSYNFLPQLALAAVHRLSEPCMGATIALRAETLLAIGGFEAFRDVLADDHAIGAAVRGLGLRLAYPPIVLVHCHPERSLAALARRELRSNVTVKRIDPLGYLGSIVTFPVPFALLAAAMGAGGWWLVGAVIARLVLALSVDRVAGASTAPKWWLPARDILGFALYLAAFAVRAVDWRGDRLALKGGGRIASSGDFPTS